MFVQERRKIMRNKIPVHMCPVCGKHRFTGYGSFDICKFCGWEADDLMEDNPDYSGGANDLSLNDYRKEYQKKIQENPNYKWIIEANKKRK